MKSGNTSVSCCFSLFLRMPLTPKLFTPNNHSRYKIRWKKITPILSDVLKNIIQEGYGWDVSGDILEVDEWERMSNNFRLKVKKGNRVKEVLLRRHIQLTDVASMELIDSLLLYLRKKQLHVPEVIHSLTGNSVYRQNGKFYQLYNFIAGDHYRGTTEELKQIVKEIAKLHIVLKDCPFEKEISKKPHVLPVWTKEGWNKIFLEARRGDSREDSTIYSLESFLRTNIRLVSSKLNNLDRVRIQVIRGDLHPHDTLFHDGVFRSFLDFEGVRMGELIRDVGNACHRFVRQYIVFQGKDWKIQLKEGLSIFLTEYRKINALNARELELLPVYISDEVLRKLYKDLMLYYQKGNRANIENGELEKKLILLHEAYEISKVTYS